MVIQDFPGSSIVCGTIATVIITPDIVTSAIAAALSAGVAAVATDTAKSAIADAYEGLKSLIEKKFGHDSDVAGAIDKLEAKPDSSARKIRHWDMTVLVCPTLPLIMRSNATRPMSQLLSQDAL
jgi:hypothetical protein